MLYIGTDLGTSSVKLILMNEKGEILNTVTEEYPLSFPNPGWSEQDPEQWYSQTIVGLKKLLNGFDKSSVAAISFGGQMHGLVALDGENRVIRPAILWNDGRTGEETDHLNEDPGKAALHRYTGNIAFAGFTAPKILWLRKHEPENFARIEKIMLPKDYLCYRLTGEFSTDVSDAAGMLLLDVKNRKWSQEMLDICGIKESCLPALHESSEEAGVLSPAIADELGLPRNIKVAAGAGDNAAAAVGTGVVGDGMCNISLGTSGTIFIPSSVFREDPGDALHSFCDSAGAWHFLGCMLSAASCNKWWSEEIIGTDDYPSLQKPIQALGENHVFFLPYLMGERSPWNDPNARGVFTGITMDTTRCDMTQAVLEGVAFGVRDMYEAAKKAGISISRSRLCGGGARSPLWRRIIANVLNLTLEIPLTEQGPSMGAAMLAMVCAGEYGSVEEAVNAIVKISDTVEPEASLVEKYDERYEQFRKLYPAMKDVFNL